ncbi:MAG: AAA family ATPase [Anaerolineales bacterium]|jgi:shikimate kinase
MAYELKDTVLIEKKPIVVELIGPAGAGKTTLLNALNQGNQKIQLGIDISETRKLAHFFHNTLHMLPTYLLRYRDSRWFSRREIRTMVYLKAWLYELRKQPSNLDHIVILDHGPIYRLALMREFGPEFTKSQRYRRWWSHLLVEWITALDVIVWLDAPNSILLERIHERDRWHVIKEKNETDAFDFLTHHRAFLEQIIAESINDHQAELLCFDTNQESVDQMVKKILDAFKAIRRF